MEILRWHFAANPADGSTSSLAFLLDGQTLVSGEESDGQNLKLWKVSDGTLLRTINGDPFAYLQAVAFSPDGSSFLSVSGYTF